GPAAKPFLSYQSPLAARAVTEAQQLVDARKPAEARTRAEAEKPFVDWLAARVDETRGGFTAGHLLPANALGSIEGTELSQDAGGVVQASGPNPNQDDYRFSATVKLPRVTGLKLEVLALPHGDGEESTAKFSRGASGEFILTDVKLQVRRRGSSQ